MNAVEIEEAVSKLAEHPFDAESFPYAFLEAFGNKPTTIQRLKSGSTNKSDLGGVLQRSNIHLKACAPGEVAVTLKALRESPKTASQKATFVLATDGLELQAETVEGEGETLACAFPDFADHFGFFLPLAGISTVRQIRENAFDIKATGRLNRLYIELLKDNPEWATAARREDLNHFMARLIFCFFAEDTGIFHSEGLFTATIEQMSARDSSNTHEVISELFRAMNIPVRHNGALDGHYREAAKIKSWANTFPYVNGGLFSDSVEVPRFSKIARSYLLHVGNLDWTKINPDIFGSMIQAVADDEERGALGMHYTSVPNILKVLNPLFLDDLRAKLEEAADNTRKLLNLRQRIARVRVFDPACGSGNFLVIAYKEMREIEAEINRRRGEAERKSEIPLTNFRGIEIRHFSCEIARLALIIAEYQCDVLYRGHQLALAEFLPLEAANWITCGNALRLDWLSLCPPAGKGVKNRADDLFETPLEQVEIDFENVGGETYICGNPPYKGARKQEPQEKRELKDVYADHPDYKDADYVTGWFLKASEYSEKANAGFALVTTSSVCQGEQVQFVWPRIWKRQQELFFAYWPFKWANNAANNAGVFVTVIGVRNRSSGAKIIFESNQKRIVENISPYLVAGPDIVVETAERPLTTAFSKMVMGNMARDNGELIVTPEEATLLAEEHPEAKRFLLPLLGTKEIVGGTLRFALHLSKQEESIWSSIPAIQKRVGSVRVFREGSPAKTTKGYASVPFRFAQYCHRDEISLALPSVTPEERAYVTPLLLPRGVMVTNLAYLIYDFGIESFALISSQMHTIWVRAVSGRLGSGIRYTPTVSYHTFPVPTLTEQNKADLSRCAEDILLAREAHFPAAISDLYDREAMDTKYPNLRAAHEQNDETLERIYIGRRFKNDTERLEKLFELYTKMTAKQPAVKKAAKKVGRRQPP